MVKLSFLVPCLGFFLSSVSFFFVHHHISRYILLTRLYEGNGVCFSRVTQTFTAKASGQVVSEHLSPEFMQITGQCYEDIIKTFQVKLAAYPVLADKLRRMTPDIYQFHERLNRKVINLSGGGRGDGLGSFENYFVGIEGLSDEVSRFIEVRREKEASLFQLYALLAGIGFLLIVAALWRYFIRDFSLRKFHRGVEQKALREAGEGDLSLERVEIIFNNLLNKYSYKNCIKLFHQYGLAFRQSQEIPKKQFTDKFKDFDFRQISLAHIIEHVCLSVRAHILSKGIKLELTIPEHLAISSDPEVAFQIIHDVFTLQIKKVEEGSHQKLMRIEARASKDEVMISFRIQQGGACKKISVRKEWHRQLSEDASPELFAARKLAREVRGDVQWFYGDDFLEVRLFFQGVDRKIREKRTVGGGRFVQRVVRGRKRDFIKPKLFS